MELTPEQYKEITARAYKNIRLAQESSIYTPIEKTWVCHGIWQLWSSLVLSYTSDTKAQDTIRLIEMCEMAKQHQDAPIHET
jgi:hypothetical protein